MSGVERVGELLLRHGAVTLPPIPETHRGVARTQRLEAGNDGAVAFLYDQASAQNIAFSRPRILSEFSGEDDLEDAHLRELALRGALVAWELASWDAIRVDLHPGPPLTAREMGRDQWLPPQRAYLDAPSGLLRLDSHGSLPFGEREPRFEGAIARVPPGRYIATLHRRDENASRRSPGLWGAPVDFITLTDVNTLRLNRRPVAVLLYPAPEHDRWEGRYTAGPEEFRGLLVGSVGALNSFAVNLDRNAAAAMNLGPGAFITVEAGGREFRALYLGDIRIDEVLEQHGPYTLAELRAAAPFLAYQDHWVRQRRRDPSTVVVLSGTSCGSYDFTGLRSGMPVEVTLEERAREPLRWASLDDNE